MSGKNENAEEAIKEVRREIALLNGELKTTQISDLSLAQLDEYEKKIKASFAEIKTKVDRIFTQSSKEKKLRKMGVKEDALKVLETVFTNSAKLYDKKLAEIDKMRSIRNLINKIDSEVSSDGNIFLNRLNDIRLNLSKQDRIPEILEKLKINAKSSQDAYEHIKSLRDNLNVVLQEETLPSHLEKLAEGQLKNANAVLERCDQLREASIEQAQAIDKEDRNFLSQGPADGPKPKQSQKPAKENKASDRNQKTSWVARLLSRKKPGGGKKSVQGASNGTSPKFR